MEGQVTYERVPLIENEETSEPTVYVYSLVFCVCLGGFLFGYDTGIISGALQPLQEDFVMSTQQKEWMVGGTTLGAILGGFFAGMLSDRFGRKPLIVCASVVFIVGSCMLAWASSYLMLILGRWIVGLGVGIASMITPVYISEVAPKDYRGRLATMNTFVVTLGQVVAYVVNIVYADTPSGWRLMFGLGAVPAFCQLMMIPWMPESPRRMVAQNELREARMTLQKIYGHTVNDAFIEDEIKSIQKDVMESTQGNYSDFKHNQYAKPLLIACLLQAAQQLSGFNTAMYYAATILRMAGFRNHQDSTRVALVVAVTNMLFTLMAVWMIDRVGRRRILISTMFSMIVCLICLGSAFAVQQKGLVPQQKTCLDYAHCSRCVLDDRCEWSFGLCQSYSGGGGECVDDAYVTYFLLISLTAYVASYALGLGYVPWIIQSELFTLSLRGKANGIATATNWIGNLFVASTFLSTTNALSVAGTFWIYAAISCILWICIVRVLPETSGKSLEEISALFKK